MMVIVVAAIGLLLVAGAPAYAHNAPAEVVAGVTKALADIGCTVDESDIEVDDGKYEGGRRRVQGRQLRHDAG